MSTQGAKSFEMDELIDALVSCSRLLSDSVQENHLRYRMFVQSSPDYLHSVILKTSAAIKNKLTDKDAMVAFVEVIEQLNNSNGASMMAFFKRFKELNMKAFFQNHLHSLYLINISYLVFLDPYKPVIFFQDEFDDSYSDFSHAGLFEDESGFSNIFIEEGFDDESDEYGVSDSENNAPVEDDLADDNKSVISTDTEGNPITISNLEYDAVLWLTYHRLNKRAKDGDDHWVNKEDLRLEIADFDPEFEDKIGANGKRKRLR